MSADVVPASQKAKERSNRSAFHLADHAGFPPRGKSHAKYYENIYQSMIIAKQVDIQQIYRFEYVSEQHDNIKTIKSNIWMRKTS